MRALENLNFLIFLFSTLYVVVQTSAEKSHLFGFRLWQSVMEALQGTGHKRRSSTGVGRQVFGKGELEERAGRPIGALR